MPTAVRSSPSPRAAGVHGQRPHRLGRCVDVDAATSTAPSEWPTRHPAPPPPSRAALARPRRRSECGRTPSTSARVSRAAAGRCPRLPMSGAIERGVLAGDRRGDAAGDRGQAQRQPRAAGARAAAGRGCARSSRRSVMTSGPAMSSERPPPIGCGRPRQQARVTSRASIGCVRLSRQSGSGMNGIRSTRRTRKRNERDRAPMTIDARSATGSGVASSSARSTSSRLARCGDERAPLGHEPAEVDDAPHAGGGAPRRRRTARRAARARRSALGRRHAPSSGRGSRRRRRPPARRRVPRR